MVRHSEYHMDLDFVSRNQIVYKVDPSYIDELRERNQYQNIVLQLCESGILADLIRIAANWVGK